MVGYLWSRFIRIRLIRARPTVISSLISSVLNEIPTHDRPTGDGTTPAISPEPFR